MGDMDRAAPSEPRRSKWDALCTEWSFSDSADVATKLAEEGIDSPADLIEDYDEGELVGNVGLKRGSAKKLLRCAQKYANEEVQEERVCGPESGRPAKRRRAETIESKPIDLAELTKCFESGCRRVCIDAALGIGSHRPAAYSVARAGSDSSGSCLAEILHACPLGYGCDGKAKKPSDQTDLAHMRLDRKVDVERILTTTRNRLLTLIGSSLANQNVTHTCAHCGNEYEDQTKKCSAYGREFCCCTRSFPKLPGL